MKKKFTLKDYGQPEYLDGAQMQFVIVEGNYPSGRTAAYADTIEEAEIIVKALNRKRKS